MHIIDTHAYVIAPAGDNAYPRIESPADWVEHAVTIEQLIALMDANGIAGVTLIQALQAHGHDNAYTLDSCDHFPDRCVAFGMFDPAAPEEAARLTREVEQRGLAGARVTPRDLEGDASQAFWQAADALETSVIIAAARPAGLPSVAAIARRYPRVRLLMEGLGLTNEVYAGPPFAEQRSLFELADLPNVYLKWCTDQHIDMPRLDWQQALLRRLIEVFGAERVMWGSRYPYRHEPEWTYASMVQAAHTLAASLGERERDLFFSGTAAQLWPTLAPSAT